MTDAETILKMIETVSPDDAARLDEIDARVQCFIDEGKYVRGGEFLSVVSGGAFMRRGHKPDELVRRDFAPRYTRSRDVLKIHRPDGYWFDFRAYGNWVTKGDSFKYQFGKEGADPVFTPQLPTEELAELHSIIQAIAYDRDKK